MPKRFFSKGEAILYGWDALTGRFLFFLSLIILVVVTNIFFSSFPTFISEKAPMAMAAAAWAMSWIILMLMEMGAMLISLKTVDDRGPRFSDLWSAYPVLVSYVAGSILYALAVAVGLALLVVPGIYLAIKLQFYGYLIIDKGMGAIEALQESGNLTQGVKINLFLFGLGLMALNILGALALGVGLFITIPMTWIASAYVYRRLQMQADNEDVPALPEPPVGVSL
jgi:uncharacterized membrane protein